MLAVVIALGALSACHPHRGASTPRGEAEEDEGDEDDIHVATIGNGQKMIRVDADDEEDEAPALQHAYARANRICAGQYDTIERQVGSADSGSTDDRGVRCVSTPVYGTTIVNCKPTKKRRGERHDVMLIVRCRTDGAPGSE